MKASAPDIIDLALQEDIGAGDITAKWFTRPGSLASAEIVARESACLAGIDGAAEVFRRIDPSLDIEIKKPDGTALDKGDIVLTVQGHSASILTAERTALNFVQRLSGVATMARRYVEAVRGTRAVILDTRKTTPGLRLMEKAAVVAGGARNHRIGLHDMFMVKDNHLATGLDLETLQKMIATARASNPGVRVELEADTLHQVRGFFGLEGVDVILLDNMSLDDMREAVRLCPEKIQLEASGGVALSTVRSIAETGVHLISVGSITHSAPAIDLALDFHSTRC
ncbi:MAG: carboxylating nicotinate-nucleotide diphosphorylase [Spartobacteria bacterium]